MQINKLHIFLEFTVWKTYHLKPTALIEYIHTEAFVHT